MPTGRASTRRAAPRPSHGDVTGNTAQALSKEHAAAVREGQARMSTVSAPVAAVDPFDEQDRAGADEERALAREAEQRSAEMSRTGIHIEALPRERPRRSLRSVSRSGDVDPDELVLVKFNDDYPGVTLGKSAEGELRTFDFEGNRPYKIPRWAYEHFLDKEMLA